MADISSLLGSAGIGGAIGKAIVQLELDTKKYQAELNAAKAETTGSANTMSSGLAKFGGLAKTAFLGAGVAAVAFGAYSVKAAIEAADAQNKLANTFENNRMLSDSSIESFNKQAAALRDLTGVDDEAITISQAMLGQFKITGQQVEELTPLIVDLSAKMGIDLAAATKSVGKAVIGNTAGLQRYGIVIEEAAGKGSEFQSVVQGLQGTVGGFARERAIDEPWRILGAKFEEVAEQVGTVLLPALQGLADWLIDYGIPAIQAFVDAVGIAADPETYTDIPIIGEAFKAAGTGIEAFAEAGQYADASIRRNGLPLLSEMKGAASAAAAGITNLGDASTYASSTLTAAAPSFRKLGKAAKGIRDDIASELPGIIGTVTTIKDTFDIKPSELVKITQAWRQIGKRIAQDLKIIGDADLKPAVRQAILALPPEMRDAFARGNDQQRNAIIKNIKATYDTEQAIPDLATKALKGGKTVGGQMVIGVVKGLESGQGTLNTAATNIINSAIDAMRKAAEVKSPSKKMERLGADLMEGLRNGIQKSDQQVLDALNKVMDDAVKNWQGQLDKLKSKAKEFGSTISGGFSGYLDLAGGFAGSGGEGGPMPLGTYLQAQLGGAQQFADILDALKRQGASKGLLANIAAGGPEAAGSFGQALLQGGPEAITQANETLKQLQGIAADTSKALTSDFFGSKIDQLKDRIDHLGDKLEKIVGQIEDHYHDIVVDGDKLASAVRAHAQQGAKRNGGSTGFN